VVINKILIFVGVLCLLASVVLFAAQAIRPDGFGPARRSRLFAMDVAPKNIRRRRDLIGLGLSIVSVLLYVAYFGTTEFGSIGRALRLCWRIVGPLGGDPSAPPVIELAYTLIVIYALRAIVRPIAAKNYRRLNARVAVSLAGITLVCVVGFSVSAMYSFGLYGNLALITALSLLAYIYASKIYLSILNIIRDRGHIFFVWLSTGLVPLLRRLVLWIWQAAKRLSRTPKFLVDAEKSARDRLDSLLENPSALEVATRQGLIAAEKEEEVEEQGNAGPPAP
jgi:hypothetical protein